MSEPTSPREALAARCVAGKNGVEPVPCPDCPVPGVFVARLSAAAYLEFLEAIRPHAADPRDTPAAARDKKAARLGVQLHFAAVDAAGVRLLDSPGQAMTLDAETAAPLIELFLEANGLAEKKSDPPNSPPAASP
jgi:hypothetical protein